MHKELSHTISEDLKLNHHKVVNTLRLLNEGATIPFIARYRKEQTGSLDEVEISQIQERFTQRKELDARRESIFESLTKRDLLTTALKQQLNSCTTLSSLEDAYLPHRQKRRTRGMIAREKGLEPLAKALFTNSKVLPDPETFFTEDLTTISEVFDGARDIIAEWINEDSHVRAQLRNLFLKEAIITSKLVKKNKEKGVKYSDYFDREEKVLKLAGHRYFAMLRGEKEKILTLSLRPQEQRALQILHRQFVAKSRYSQEMQKAIEDSYKRLLSPSLENELRKTLKEKADKEAIEVFVTNIRELLLAPPLGRKSVLALDPGFRTGAKLVCLDAQGQLLHTDTIYPTHGGNKLNEAKQIVSALIPKYHIQAVAIGNGTASRETEAFIKGLELPSSIIITMVNEDGASIYSASESARLEFPEHDLTVRGSISIGRRLQDPLAELVKIDPKSVGVGQYQHDVDQSLLKNSLEQVIISCVNRVGVEVNSASKELLSYVSGLGPVLAQNIIDHRNSYGPFKSRKELLKVKRLGPKAYEQCAGFLRIRDGINPLDNSSVHPERYKLVEQMARDSDCGVTELIKNDQLRIQIDIKRYQSQEIGLPTLKDILSELAKPGRDPREQFSQHSFAEGVHTVEDLIPEMVLPGIVTNVTNFGAFVDIGVHQDGLVHISQLADRFVKDPNEIVKPRQQVKVRVLEVDKKRNRIALTMRNKV